jgi:hypothetical protein
MHCSRASLGARSWGEEKRALRVDLRSALRISPGSFRYREIPGQLSMLTLMTGKADLRFALTRCWSGATVSVVKPGGGLPTRSTASGMGLKIPAVDLWTTRLCFMRGLGIVASTGCYREPWRLES